MNRKEINAMTDEELCVKAARIIGLNVVHEEWPCGYPPESCGLEADQMPVLDNNEWTTDSPDWYNRKHPVYLESGLERYWPPKYDDKCDDWMTAVEPVPDYPNDTEAAWELTSKVPGCRWSVYELDEGGWAAVVMGKIEPINGRTLWDVVAESGPDTAPRAITKAFIMAMEAE